jgi:hypothetical protein
VHGAGITAKPRSFVAPQSLRPGRRRNGQTASHPLTGLTRIAAMPPIGRLAVHRAFDAFYMAPIGVPSDELHRRRAAARVFLSARQVPVALAPRRQG